MKVNLIYDLRYGGAGIGGFSEERKEDAVIAVLRSARHDEEFSRIVSRLKVPGNSSREPVEIDDLLDFEQQQKYERLKKMHNYKPF